MPRSSRHRSHRGHRHDRDRSGSPSSDEEVVVVVERSGTSRKRRDGSPPQQEESESKRRKTSSPLTRVVVVPVEVANAAADPTTDQVGRKRKERDSKPTGEGDAAAGGGTDRWNGDAGVDGPAEDKRMKVDGPASPDAEKSAKGKLSASDSKTRAATTGRRHSGADGTCTKDDVVSPPKDESSRRRAEKESARKDTTTDREKERVPDKDHTHGLSRNGEKSSDKDNRGHHHAQQRKDAKEQEPELSKEDKSKRSKERPPNADVDVPHNPDRDAGRKMQDDLFSSDTDRKQKKQIPREASSDKGKSKGDGRDNEDRANDLDRNGDSRDPEKHRRYRDRSREDIDRDRRPRDDRHRIGADRPSRDHSNDRSESRYQKDMSKRTDNYRRQEKERESPPSTRDHAKYMDSRVRKRPVAEKEDSTCTKSRGEVEFQAAVERNRLESDYNNDDRTRPESVHSNKVHSNSRHKQPRSSSNSAIHILQDEYRRSTREEPAFHSALSKDRNHTSSASSGDRASISGAAEKALDSFSVESNAKIKETPRSADCIVEDGRPPKSDSQFSGIQVPERSPGSDRCNTDRKGNISSDSPRKIPPPPVRHGSGSPSVQGSAEYDGKTQSADHRNFSRYKRNGDSKMGRGHGSSWNGVPNWPRPGLNGYMPFPHGPPGPFHQVGQQYPGPSLFGVRPLMDFNHAGVPFHMHEAPDRFSGRQFGWHNPSGDSGPQFSGWDGNGGMFGNDSRVFGREWEHGRHPINQGWETSGVMKGQDEKSPMELESDKRPDLSAQVRTNENITEEFENQSKRNLMEHDNMRQKATTPLVQRESDSKLKTDSALKPSNNDNSPSFLGQVLSKLDISLNLTCPELYRRINSNQIGGNTSSHSSVLKQMNGQASVEKPNSGATRRFINGTRPSLPNIAEEIFKKAVSLYQISGETGNGIKVSKGSSAEENIKRNTFSGENKTSLDVPTVDKDNNRTVNRLPENALEPMDVGDTDVEEQEPATTAKSIGDYNNDLNNVSSLQLCKNQVGSDLVESCAKECVGLILEFVSRIHSPGSSH